jgi:hypothetical protein
VIDSGTVLQGRFLIEDKIGVGGMGAVYRAVDQKFGSRVAIKETFYGDTNLAEAFEREARLLNGLHHAILPHVSDYFSENGGHFLVMEFIEGEDMSEILKRGEVLPVPTVLGWALDLLDGLDYLHSQDPPVIHRDIKPNNLKLTSRGKIMLLDFGMAKETTSNTLAGQSVFGYSRRYSPLEQIEGTGTDERSDIFSLGASIYHLITGKAAVDVLARASAIVGGRPDPLVPANVINPEVPEPVAAILSSALSLNADNRFESARAMSNALEHVISSNAADQVRQQDSAAALAAPAAAAIALSGPVPHVPPTLENGSEREIDVTEPVFEAAEQREETRPASERFVEGAAAGAFFSGAGNKTRSHASSGRPVAGARRPAGPSYAVWLSLLILCIALVLEAAYRGIPVGDESSTNTADVAAATEDNIVEPAEPPVEITGQDGSQAMNERPIEKGADELSQRRGPVAVRQPNAPMERDGESRLPEEESTSARAPVRRVERRTPTLNAAERTPRRVVRPAFEQPSVSSIEMIMTGIPYERGRRADDAYELSEEERRERRRMRRAMRRNMRPF